MLAILKQVLLSLVPEAIQLIVKWIGKKVVPSKPCEVDHDDKPAS